MERKRNETNLHCDLDLNKLSNKTVEDAVLGAILLEGDKLSQVEGVIDSTAFYDPTNAKVWNVIQSVSRKRLKVDLFSVNSEAKAQGENLLLYLTQLTQCVGSAMAVEQHARILRELETKRRLVAFGVELSAKAQSGNMASLDLIDALHKQLDELSLCAGVANESRHISDTIGQCIAELEDRQKMAQSGQAVGITTGLQYLNRATAGWRGGQLVVMAGRPAMGKSAIMLHFAKSAAKAGRSVCIYSLEMSVTQLAGRLLVGEAGVSNEAYRLGRIESSDWGKIEIAGSELGKCEIYLNDSPDITMSQIGHEANMMHRKGKCDLLLIDYLQLIGSNTRNQSREREVAEMSREAKILAKSLNIPVILLSQLSRKVEERADKTPLLSDLRESGAIEQDADLVIFVDRPEYYGIDSVTTQSFGEIITSNVGRLIVAKNREGMTGDCWFSHNGELTRIWDYSQPLNGDCAIF